MTHSLPTWRPWSLVMAFVAVVASFVAATAYSQFRAAEIDRAASAIARDHAPGIQYLAAARLELVQLLASLEAHVREPGDEEALERVRAAQRNVGHELDQYLRLEASGDEQILRQQLQRQHQAVDATIKRILELAAGGKPTPALARATRELGALVDAERVIVTGIVELKADRARVLAERIELQRSSASVIAYALDLASMAFSAVAFTMALKVIQRHAKLLEASSRLSNERALEFERFAGRVAHDVLGPLSPMSLFLHRVKPLLEGSQPLSQGLARAESGLRSVRQLVQDLLDYARAGAQPAPNAHTPVAEALRDLKADLTPVAEADGIELSLEGAEKAEGLAVRCSPGVLASLLQNLVRNAIKYMGAAEPRSIRIRVQPGAALLRFEVEDTGPGLPPGAAASIFEPYVRGPETGKPGIGLGLATVKRLAEGHGGRVGVQTTGGRGSVFWFELPYAQAIAPTAASA